ncbi:PREDICTED: limulus clotting factor C-like, partial [Wasmannia auropunctata]|uniref:limulus clotting factor C-like n=1 Tax=Wasmannia auropunctata TaxID=64793 RepID=UPI0005EE7E9C
MKMRHGTSLIYSCNLGYKIKGTTNVRCLWGEWSTIPDCIAIGCKVSTTVSTEVRCMHDDKWISCENVPPGTKAILYCQNGYRPEINVLSAQGNTMTCIANGQWELKPMRCVPACGTLRPSDMKPTIVDGVRPNVTEFPWHASLYRDKSGKKEYFCGASLITENLLITAAHCVFDENTKQLIDASKIYVLMGNLFRDYNSTFHNQTFVKENQVCKCIHMYKKMK